MFETLPAPEVLFFLVLASGLAGFIDAAAGGGGLINLPALMLALPTSTPYPTLLGTNKVIMCSGTFMAVIKYWRTRVIRFRQFFWSFLFAFSGAALGVWASYQVSSNFLRPILIVILTLMLLFLIFKPQLGTGSGKPDHINTKELCIASAICLCIGFYDGFFGPGTGALLLFLFVTLVGLNFIQASALTKMVNFTTNVTSLCIFIYKGSWLPGLALILMVSNSLGGYWGAHMAITKGSKWVRLIFITVVAGLILRLSYMFFLNG